MSFGKWQLGKCEKVDKCKTVEALKFLSKNYSVTDLMNIYAFPFFHLETVIIFIENSVI